MKPMKQATHCSECEHYNNWSGIQNKINQKDFDAIKAYIMLRGDYCCFRMFVIDDVNKKQCIKTI